MSAEAAGGSARASVEGRAAAPAGAASEENQAPTSEQESAPQPALAQATAMIDAALRFARFPEAARLAEEHVARYADEPGSKQLLARAIALRIGLRQIEHAHRDVDLAERLYGADDAAWIAGLVWALGELATTDDARTRHADDYLRRFADDGAEDRRIVAEVLVADDLWRRSCKGGETLGLCLAPPTKASASRRCGPPPELRRAKRQPRLAAQAQQRYERVRRFRWQSSPRAEERLRDAIPTSDHRRRQELSDALERAELAATDARFEELLAIDLPRGLNFYVEASACERAAASCRRKPDKVIRTAHTILSVPSPAVDPAECARSGKICRSQRKRADDSRDRLAAVLDEINDRIASLSADYSSLIGRTTSVNGALRAALRLGQLHLSTSALLGGAALPRGLAEPARSAYCEALSSRTTPYLEAGANALFFCSGRATTYQVSTDSSEACEAELVRLWPEEFPALVEFIGAPTLVDDEVLAPRSEGVQLEAPAEHRPRPAHTQH